MILPALILPKLSNQHFTTYGMDSLEKCKDKAHFQSYPYKISYDFNSRGFRDQEWPSDLKDAIWCIGDSFTVGIGSPIEHTWPYILSEKTGKRCINVSMGGASNKWIARIVKLIQEEIAPDEMIVQWSYLWRDELPDSSLSDDERIVDSVDLRTITNQQLVDHFLESFNSVKNYPITHSIIPYATEIDNEIGIVDNKTIQTIWDNIKGPDWPIDPKDYLEVIDELASCFKNEKDKIVSSLLYNKETKDMITLEQLDFARDSHHYDIVTATTFVDSLIAVRSHS